MINLQPRAVRILEQHRVIAGGKAVVSRFVNDMCADFYKEVIRLVDIGTLFVDMPLDHLPKSPASSLPDDASPRRNCRFAAPTALKIFL